MLNAISTSWKNNLVNDVHNKARFYANFRGIEYPAMSGTAAYSAETSGHYTSGTVNLSSGTLKYLIPLAQPMTIDCHIAYTNGADHDFITWHETENDYTKRLKVFSISGGNIVCDWNESSSQIISCAAGISVFAPSDTLYPSNTLYPADITSVDYRRLTFVFNNGTSYVYVDGVLCASGSTAAIATNKNWLDIDATGQIVDYIKIIPAFAATDTDVANAFENVYNSEIYFPFNNQSTAFERCQITSYVTGYNIDLPGEFKSTQAGLSLNNISGEFSADQYAAFSPENGSYNGTSAQSYLSRKIPVWIESWAEGEATEPDFEPIFVGNIAANSFARSTNAGDFSRISVQADSIIADIAKRIFRTGRKFEDYYLARTTDTGTSLFHELVKLGTQKEVYNYATNASFENTTIGNSWAGAISRDNTHAFVGTYGGYINSATTVKTTVVTELTKYERFTFSVWAYSTSAISVTMQMRDMLSATPNGTTSSVNSHTGNGWQLLTVTHDVANSSSDRLECSITTTGTPALWLDAACLNYGNYKPMISANTNDGTSAVSQRADGVLTAYQICGAIGEDVSYQHPWAVFAKDENAWEKLKQLSEASLARHLYTTPDGIIKLVTAATAPVSSIAAISDIASISASTQSEQANKLKVSGVKITEKTDMRIWNLNDSNALAGDTLAPSGSFQRTTGAGDYFPLLTEAPDGLECVYNKEALGE